MDGILLAWKMLYSTYTWKLQESPRGGGDTDRIKRSEHSQCVFNVVMSSWDIWPPLLLTEWEMIKKDYFVCFTLSDCVCLCVRDMCVGMCVLHLRRYLRSQIAVNPVFVKVLAKLHELWCVMVKILTKMTSSAITVKIWSFLLPTLDSSQLYCRYSSI